mgnify:CR=1 FL=1
MGLFQKIFGTYSERELKSIYPIADQIEALADEYKALSDAELQAKTPAFKERLANGETLDDILPEAFATVREAADRVLGLRPYRVQLIGGIVLHQGRIAEMKTGEGKTLVATLPAYLNALSGEGVHIVTVNDYLAKRDSEWMGKVHRFLGLTVGLIVHDMDKAARQAAYAADITYGTNNEMGFDYLRDNMALYASEQVQRGHSFAIVDEVDSILIDEARTPLIISGQGEKSSQLYEIADRFAAQLSCLRVKEVDAKEEQDDIDADYIVDEKAKTATLTPHGQKRAEAYFKVENLSDPANTTLQHHINQAIKARGVMQRDVDYVVRDGQVIIVDEFTGRLMFGRRYNEGLHQAIEAKEGVKVEHESKTLATITFQNYFRLYGKLSGMTGTALTEEEEFRHTYQLDVIEIPTNKPIARKDNPDAVYKNERGKIMATIARIEQCHAKGQPILVGTVSIEKSEELSKILKAKGIKHTVLNAKYHEREAEIVAQAGKPGAVTIATNMAGRGTDIKLDEEAKAAGGLKIIGTERHESRRIDNQLRGRSGRQGDPGESRFYISLEDDLMRLFGSEKMISMFNALGIPEGQEIEHKMLSKAIENAQKKIEGNNFGIRKNLLEYDQVNNEQREIIYAERRRVLDGESMRDVIYKMITDIVDNTVDMVIGEENDSEEWNLAELNSLLLPIIPLEPITKERISKPKKDSLKQQLKEEAVRFYETKEAEFPEPEMIREAERVVLLKVIDRKWMNHIDDMDQLRQGIGLQAYGQRDPLVEYKMNAYEMFENMTESIKEDTIRVLCHIRIEQKVEREQVAKVTGTNKDESGPRRPAKRESVKIYPNDPCPCGSGKKYKNCCGKNR